MTSTPSGQAPAHTLWLQACGIFLCAIVALATLDMLAKDLVARHPAPLVNLVRYGTVLLMAVVLNRTLYGRWVIAIGQNPRAAELAGGRIGRVRFATYVLSALLASLCGLLLAGFSGGASLSGKRRLRHDGVGPMS